MTQYKWVFCPICGGKTRTKIRPDTEAKNLIVFCSKCKNESVIDIEPHVYDENSVEQRISCGRTQLRGNWVKIMRNGFSVCLSSDGEKPFSQIRLREMCLEILNKFA